MKTCLVIDDSRVVRKVSCRILGDIGFDLAEAENGQVAYELCTKSMPDLILLDWNMPVMSGIEFLEKLRRLEKGMHPKVILCTTENDMEHIQRAVKAGADEYIMKPFDSSIIKSKLALIGMGQ